MTRILTLLGALSVAVVAACAGLITAIWWLASGMDDDDEPDPTELLETDEDRPTQRDPRPDEYDRILAGDAYIRMDPIAGTARRTDTVRFFTVTHQRGTQP